MSETYWSKTGFDYDKLEDKYSEIRYPQHTYRNRRVFEMLDFVFSQANKSGQQLRLLDIGCGYGRILEYALRNNVEAVGIDYVPSMVDLAKQHLTQAGYGSARVEEGNVLDLSRFAPQSFDVITAIQVFGYLPREDEKKYMSEVARVLKPNGHLITAEPNLIFDIGTFNKFTTTFWNNELLGLSFKDPAEKNEALDLVKSFMTNPNLPEKPKISGDGEIKGSLVDREGARFSSHRDFISSKAENPLDYANVLNKYGLELQDLAFYRFHIAPPLSFAKHPDWEKRAEALEDKYCRAWQGHFLASSFVSRSRLRAIS